MRIGKIIVITMLIVFVFASSAFAEDRVSLGFLYGTTSDLDLIDRTKGSINQVSPTCFDLDNRGNLYVTGNLTHTFVDAMHERGILVTPFLSNHWARSKGRKAIQNADMLANQVVAKIMEYNLDGVNVDIENLNEDDRDNLTNFVRILREVMPEGKLLTVSVAANPWAKEEGWQGSYDYQKLGEYADYLFVMAYDEHSQGGPEGPVASNAFVENSIIYALQYVSKDKIVLGIPFFGRYWKEEVDENNNVTLKGGEAVVIGAVPNLTSKHKGIVEYDEAIGEAKLTFTINNEVISSTLNGKLMEDGNYVVWYQSNDAIKSKLDLINKYDLLGSGVWALGQEKVEVWEYFKIELNKTERQTESALLNNDIVSEAKLYEAIKEEARIEIAQLSLHQNRIIEEKRFEQREVREREEEEAPHIHNELDGSIKKLVTTEKDFDYDKKSKKLLKKSQEIVRTKLFHRFRMEKVW